VLLCCDLYFVVYLLEISETGTCIIKAAISYFSIYVTEVGVSSDANRPVHLLLILPCGYCCISFYSYHFLLVQLQGQLLSVHG
jgi:hypothetical protein